MNVGYISKMFLVFYDTVWMVVVYNVIYWGTNLFFKDYSQALKIIADIDADHFGYNMDFSSKERHIILFSLVSPMAFFILTVNPIIHTFIYMIFMYMLNVTDINRILFYILLFKLAKNVNLFDRTVHFKQNDAIILIQMLMIMFEYNNTSVVLPSLFQIIDELPGIYTRIIPDMLSSHNKLFKCDTKLGKRVIDVNVFFQSNRKVINWIRFITMGIVSTVYLVYVANLSRVMDVIFCYYATARLVNIFINDLKMKQKNI